MSPLNESQFPTPGESREIDGVPHHFVGYHMTEHADFKPNATYQHQDNAMGADDGHLYVTHDPTYWKGFMEYNGDRTHAVEAWERTKSPEEVHKENGSWISKKTATAWATNHIPTTKTNEFTYSGHEGTVDPRSPDVRLGRTHEFGSELQKHVASYQQESIHDNHLALGPGPRRVVRYHKIQEGPEAGKIGSTTKIVQARAYGGR